MRQLIINNGDIYEVNGVKYFKFTNGYINYRDLNCDLSKIDKYMLGEICNYCKLDSKGLTKKNLIKLITDSNCLIMN